MRDELDSAAAKGFSDRVTQGTHVALSLMFIGAQMQAELDSAAAKGIAGRDTVEPLQRLAAELVLVAAAAQVGVLGYVMGRSHAM